MTDKPDISHEAIETMAQACVQTESLASRFDFQVAAALRAQADRIAELEACLINILEELDIDTVYDIARDAMNPKETP